VRLYEEILAIAREYMGVAAEDYIRRRIRIVMRGEVPENIGFDRLHRLAAGIEMTARGYMSEKRAQDFYAAILALARRRDPNAGSAPGSTGDDF
jgi:hypothetical protein